MTRNVLGTKTQQVDIV